MYIKEILGVSEPDAVTTPPKPATVAEKPGERARLHLATGKKSETGKTMPSEKNQNVQDVFLNYVRKNKTPLTVFLVNGVKLQGVITWFDNFCVLLRRDGHVQLVYKHAISTVMPTQAIQLFEPTREDEAPVADAGS